MGDGTIAVVTRRLRRKIKKIIKAESGSYGGANETEQQQTRTIHVLRVAKMRATYDFNAHVPVGVLKMKIKKQKIKKERNTMALHR